MSSDFLSDEELAELEAELADLDDEPEAEGTSEEALEETPKEAPKGAELEGTEAPEPEVDEDAELEAELNALGGDEDSELLAQAEERKDDETVSVDLEEIKAEAEVEAELAEEEAVEEVVEEVQTPPTENTTSATNNSDSDDDLVEMLTNASSSFNPRQLQKDLAFREDNLDDAFMSQAGMFAHYSGVAHRAARRYDNIAQQVKLVEARLDQEIRQEASHTGEKITETLVKNRILLDPRHRKITERMLDAKAVAAMTKDACEAFKQRRDMLIQFGANVREEHKGELRLKAAQESRSDMQKRALGAMNQG